MDASDRPDPRQLEIFCRMTPHQKLELIGRPGASRLAKLRTSGARLRFARLHSDPPPMALTIPQDPAPPSTGTHVRVLKKAQDQQEVEGQAAVRLIQAAGEVATPGPEPHLGQHVSTHA